MNASEPRPDQPRPAITITAARSEASRRNGSKSSGPVSMAGKHNSRMNAMKTGIFAKVIPHRELPLIYDRHEYCDLIEEYRHDFQPNSRIADNLVESLAFDTLRLRFLMAAEMQLMEGPPVERREASRFEDAQSYFSNVSDEELSAGRSVNMKVMNSQNASAIQNDSTTLDLNKARERLTHVVFNGDPETIARLLDACKAPKRTAVRLGSAKQAAELLGACVKTVYRYADAGHITRIRLSKRKIRFDMNEIEELAARGIDLQPVLAGN